MNKKDIEASEKICSYLREQNRPYSLNDIFMNLHKEFGKTAVQKCLDSLVQKDTIKEKVYGKQKVYVINQNDFPTLNENELKSLDVPISKKNEELQGKIKRFAELESKLKNIGNSLTTEQIQLKIDEYENNIDALDQRLSKIQSKGTSAISQQDKERIEEARASMLKEWKKRRRMATDMTDAILEGYPKSKKELFDDIGIETDADTGVDINKFS